MYFHVQNWWVAVTHPIITMGLLTGTVQNWLAVQNVIRILVTIYIQNLLPACRPIFKEMDSSQKSEDPNPTFDKFCDCK